MSRTARYFGIPLPRNHRSGGVAITAINRASSVGASMDAADRAKSTRTQTAAATISARVSGENPIWRYMVGLVDASAPLMFRLGRLTQADISASALAFAGAGQVIRNSSQSVMPSTISSTPRLMISNVRLTASIAESEYVGLVPSVGAINMPDCGLVRRTKSIRHAAPNSRSMEKAMPRQPAPRPTQRVVRIADLGGQRAGSFIRCPNLM